MTAAVEKKIRLEEKKKKIFKINLQKKFLCINS